MLRNDKKRSIFAPAKENNSMHLGERKFIERLEK